MPRIKPRIPAGFFALLFVLNSVFFFFSPFLSADELTAIRPYSRISLDPIIISSALRVGVYEGRVAEDAVVLTDENVEALPARDLSEVLKYVPGVDAGITNQFGQPASVTIKGSESRHVLIMVDDIPFNTQLSGQANPTRIPIENIQRLEVIRGAASSAWGSSLGGVINAITKDVGKTTVPTGSITNSFAEFGTRKHSLELSGKAADLGYFGMASFLSTDGIRSSSDVQETKAFGKVAHALGDEAKLSASFGYSGANVRDGVLPTNRINSTPYYSRYGKAALEIDKGDLSSALAFKYNNQDVVTDIFNGTTGAQVSSTVSKNVYRGISFNAKQKVGHDDLLVMGVDTEWHTLKSSSFLDTAKDISMQAPYASYVLKLEAWEIIPALRFDHNEHFGSQLSPSLGSVYRFRDSNNTAVRAKVSRAFNAPPLLWIFNDDPSLLVGPSPDLKAERAIVYEIGGETHFSRLDVGVNLYWMEIKDAIATVFDAGQSVFRKENFRKFRRQGASLELKYRISSAFKVSASGAFNHVVNRSTGQIVRGNGTARQSFRLGAEYRNRKGFEAYLYGNYDRWDSVASQAPNDRKFIFDVRMTQALPRVSGMPSRVDASIFLNIYNIANSKYWSSRNFPLPGRYFEGGVTVEF